MPRLRHHRSVGAVRGDVAAGADDAAGLRPGAAQAACIRVRIIALRRATVQVPIPRAGGVGAPRIRDLELVQMVADLVSALDGKPRGEPSKVGITNSTLSATPSATLREERQAR